MRATLALATGLILTVLAALSVLAADPPASDALLPAGLVMEETYRPGPGSPVGKVASITGQAIIVHAGDLQGCLAEANYALYAKDLIVTREQGRAVIELNDGSTITLSEITRLVIDHSVYDPAAGTRESFLGMSLGKARFWVQKIVGAKRASFRVKTDNAVAGVRGSDFVVQAAASETVVTALKNTRLEVFGLTAPDEVVTLTDFQRTVVAAGRAPSPPETVAVEEIERLMDASASDAGSEVSAGSRIVNTLSGSDMTNVAVGEASEANLGTVKLKGATVSGTVVNQATGKGLANVATGKNAAANMGVVKIENSTVQGTIVNRSEAQNVKNVADGPDSEANVGAVVVE